MQKKNVRVGVEGMYPKKKKKGEKEERKEEEKHNKIDWKGGGGGRRWVSLITCGEGEKGVVSQKGVSYCDGSGGEAALREQVDLTKSYHSSDTI